MLSSTSLGSSCRNMVACMTESSILSWSEEIEVLIGAVIPRLAHPKKTKLSFTNYAVMKSSECSKPLLTVYYQVAICVCFFIQK